MCSKIQLYFQHCRPLNCSTYCVYTLVYILVSSCQKTQIGEDTCYFILLTQPKQSVAELSAIRDNFPFYKQTNVGVAIQFHSG